MLYVPDRIVPSASITVGRPFVPERRGADGMLGRWLALALDELDHGVLLLSGESHVVHVNQVARAELDQEHPLQLMAEELRARHAKDVLPVRAALSAAAQKGHRTLLSVGVGAKRVSVSVVPLNVPLHEDRPATLLMFGKRQICGELTVQGFARCHGLTPAEAQVLKGLCEGASPGEIATRQGVALSTVRTQISRIRNKTGAHGIRDLVRQVAVLPPLVSVLR